MDNREKYINDYNTVQRKPKSSRTSLKRSTANRFSEISFYRNYGLSGNRNSVEARFSAPVQTGPGAHLASCTMDTELFSGVESGRGVTLTPHPFLVPRSKNRVELYLYSP
jgi:hypothetical protein